MAPRVQRQRGSRRSSPASGESGTRTRNPWARSSGYDSRAALNCPTNRGRGKDPSAGAPPSPRESHRGGVQRRPVTGPQLRTPKSASQSVHPRSYEAVNTRVEAEAVHAFLGERDDFKRGGRAGEVFLSFNPDGYLRRTSPRVAPARRTTAPRGKARSRVAAAANPDGPFAGRAPASQRQRRSLFFFVLLPEMLGDRPYDPSPLLGLRTSRTPD
jgi:hypothetical protein